MAYRRMMLGTMVVIVSVCAFGARASWAQEEPPPEEPPPPPPTATTDIDDQSFGDPGGQPLETKGQMIGVPMETLALSFDYLHHSNVYVPGLLYSSAHSQLDLGAQYVRVDGDGLPDLHGWNAFARVRLTGRRERVGELNACESYGTGTSLLMGYQRLSSVGDVWSAGLARTVRLPRCDHFRPALSVRYLSFDPEQPARRSPSTAAVGLALRYYDVRLPHLEENGTRAYPEGRPWNWRWSYTLGYEFANAVIDGDQLSMSVRYRPYVHKAGGASSQQKAHQYSFTLGVDRQNDFFFGLGSRYTHLSSTRGFTETR